MKFYKPRANYKVRCQSCKEVFFPSQDADVLTCIKCGKKIRTYKYNGAVEGDTWQNL